MGKNELQKTESPLMTAAALVQANGDMDVAKLKELLELQERWDATQAKKAYVQAMADFKENPPEILKDKHVSHPTKQGGQKEYNHATLYNVTTTINTELSKYGLTASWKTSQENSSVKVTCIITHILGHSEETFLFAPSDPSGGKNPIQAIGSTVTYLQRYTLLALTGLATYEQDDDGAGTGKGKEDLPAKPNEKQNETLNAICTALQKQISYGRAAGRQVLKDKVSAIFLTEAGRYPKPEGIQTAIKWLIGLNKEDEWARPKPEPEPKDTNKYPEAIFSLLLNRMREMKLIYDDDYVCDKDKLYAEMKRICGGVPKSQADVDKCANQINPGTYITPA